MISTSKYNPLTFIPKNLFEQFRRAANLFFLTLLILQFFPEYQTINPVLAAIPLFMVVGLTALKDGVEDMRRHKSDKSINAQPVDVVGTPWVNTNSAFNVETPGSFDMLRGRRKRALPGAQNGGTNSNRKVGPERVGWEKRCWGQLKVGDVVLIRDNEAIPADIMILATSEPDCLCYVETKNLDGETNLKIRKGTEETAFLSPETIDEVRNLQLMVETETPTPNLYSFTGTAVFPPKTVNLLAKRMGLSQDGIQLLEMNLRDGDVPDVVEVESIAAEDEELKCSLRMPLGINSLLLRGCILRNTGWVIGLVIFTGFESKIYLNAGETPSKQSQVEKEMNHKVVANLLILVVISVILCVVGPWWEAQRMPADHSHILWLETTYTSAVTFSWAWEAFTSFWASMITFQNIVPISLYITMEVVKTCQVEIKCPDRFLAHFVKAFFINSDSEMYYEPIDQPCIPKSWNLADDLGLIDYIFSDKTGTLTQNIMQFKKCSINGIMYGDGQCHLQRLSHASRTSRASRTNPVPPLLAKTSSTTLTNIARRHAGGKNSIYAVNNHPTTRIDQAKAATAHYIRRKVRRAQEFLRRLKLDRLENASLFGVQGSARSLKAFGDPLLTHELSDAASVQYPALRDFFTSLAVCHSVLVSGAPETSDIKYLAQSPDEAALVQAARDVGFTFLSRAGSSIMVDCVGEREESRLLNVIEFNSVRKRMSVIVKRPAGEIVLYCKGADSVIFERLREGQEDIKEITARHLEEFAGDGLRTLCIAYTILPEDLYNEWAIKYQAASVSLTDREEKVDEVAEEIERGMLLMGATAIEDKLQDGVSDCIETLSNAGIKIWVLTGDKMETAINIGLSCNLLTKDMNLILIRGEGRRPDGADGTVAQLKDALKRFWGEESAEDGGAGLASSAKSLRFERYGLVIDGGALKHALDPDGADHLMAVASRCVAVICCRVSPLQKAKVVEMVKTKKKAMCLAIGDGANDVSMIQAANIGVGIAGEEGLQAVMASDYAIAHPPVFVYHLFTLGKD
ncbi:hypothetical protein HK101_000497 [Irineochytrium annulatum]|nr:hypothetical protein HK101_000497 [Irineochytrium annulatum]